MSTKIEWADVAHNVVRGCSPASDGCRFCYAARMDGTRQKHRTFTDASGEIHTLGSLVKLLPGKPKRGARGQEMKAREPGRYVYNGQVYLDPSALQAALDLPRVHKGTRGYSVFWNFRSDTFHEALTNEEIAAQFGVMAARPDLTFLVLTKRARRMREWFERIATNIDPAGLAMEHAARVCGHDPLDMRTPGPAWPLPNVRLGVSAENQETADERIPELVETPAAGNFVSLEPMLGHIDVSRWLPALNWLIVGAESGPNARPAELAWVRSVRDQVLASRDGRAVPEPGDPHLFVKQWDVCEACDGSAVDIAPEFREEYVRANTPRKGPRDISWWDGHGNVYVCEACIAAPMPKGQTGKVRKGNPKLDGRSWAEVPR